MRAIVEKYSARKFLNTIQGVCAVFCCRFYADPGEMKHATGLCRTAPTARARVEVDAKTLKLPLAAAGAASELSTVFLLLCHHALDLVLRHNAALAELSAQHVRLFGSCRVARTRNDLPLLLLRRLDLPLLRDVLRTGRSLLARLAVGDDHGGIVRVAPERERV